MIVSKQMYGCGALVWYQCECDNLGVMQVGKRRNARVRGEFLGSLFSVKEMKGMVD